MLARRKFLNLLKVVPFVSPIATKQSADSIAEKLIGLSMDTSNSLNSGSSDVGASVSRAQRKIALLIPGVREQVEKLFRQQNKEIYRIDPDLAVLKSVSLSAKIAYQRQRIVKKSVEDLTTGYCWDEVDTLVRKALSLKE